MAASCTMQFPVSTNRLEANANHLNKASGKSIGHDNPMQLPLLDLLHNHPGGTLKTGVGPGFTSVFARHPQVAALRDHKDDHDQYVQKVMDIRKPIKHDRIARVNLRKAIVSHMEQNNIDPFIVKSVKNHYDNLNARMAIQRYRQRLKIKDPEKLKAQYKRSNLRRNKDKKGKRKEGIDDLEGQDHTFTFEQQLELHDIPKDADAFIIEKASRNFQFRTKMELTKQLELYLSKRFGPQQAQLAMSKRRMELKEDSHRNAVRRHRMKKGMEGRAKASVEEPVGTKKARQAHTERNVSTSTRAPLVPDSKQQTSMALHSGISFDANRFDDTEWWNDI